MDILVRTADEFHADHVTIEIRGSQREAEEVSQRLTGGSEHELYGAALQAERELVKAQRRTEELERDLATAQRAREIETRRANDAEEKIELSGADRHAAELVRKTQRVAELEVALERYQRAHVCTDRCADNAHVAFEGNRLVKDLEAERDKARAEARSSREEMGRRFTTAQVEDAKAGAREDERARLAREVIKPLNTRMSQIHAAVLGTELARELEQYRSAHAATLLVEALGEVRRITGVTSV